MQYQIFRKRSFVLPEVFVVLAQKRGIKAGETAQKSDVNQIDFEGVGIFVCGKRYAHAVDAVHGPYQSGVDEPLKRITIFAGVRFFFND